jgi:hypothetical protein
VRAKIAVFVIRGYIQLLAVEGGFHAVICMLAAEWRGRLKTKQKEEEKQDGRSEATP